MIMQASFQLFKVTPEVHTTGKCIYVIRIDGEECNYAQTEQEALRVIESYTENYIKLYRKQYGATRKVFREGDEKCHRVLTQTPGWVVDGAPHVKNVIDYVRIGEVGVTKDRLELDGSCKRVIAEDASADEVNDGVVLPAQIKVLYDMNREVKPDVEAKPEEAKPEVEAKTETEVVTDEKKN
jgi:hypothetical protein